MQSAPFPVRGPVLGSTEPPTQEKPPKSNGRCDGHRNLFFFWGKNSYLSWAFHRHAEEGDELRPHGRTVPLSGTDQRRAHAVFKPQRIHKASPAGLVPTNVYLGLFSQTSFDS